MIIESIHVDDFGKLHSFDLTFHKEMNIIEGDNESGKSTLAAFIRFLLYGFPPAEEGRLSEKQKRLSWSSGKAAGSMIVSAAGKRYEIFRSVDADSETVRTVDMETGLPAFPRSSPGEAILGVPDSLFDNTAFIGQISDAHIGGKPIAEAIENVIFSGDEKISTDRALEKLTEARNSLLHPSGKGGVLYTLRQKQEELARRLAIAKKENLMILEKEARLVTVRQKKNESEKSEAACRKLETDYKNAMLIKTYDYLHQLEENSDAIVSEIKAWEDENTVGGVLLDRSVYDTCQNYLAEEAEKRRSCKDAERAYTEAVAASVLPEEEAKLLRLCETHGGDAAVREEAKAYRREFGLLTFLSFVILAVAGGFAAVMAFVFHLPFTAPDLSTIFFYIGEGLLLIGFSVFFPLSLAKRKTFFALANDYGAESMSELRIVLDSLHTIGEEQKRLHLAEEEARAAMMRVNDRYLDFTEDVARYLMRFGETLPEEDPAAFLRSFSEKILAFLDRRADLEKKKAGIDNVIAELRGQIGNRSEVQVRATVPPADRDRLAAMNHKEILDGIETYRRLYRLYDDRERELERQLIASRAKAEDPTVLTAEMEEIRERMNKLLLRHSAYDLAEEAIRSAGERLRTEISPRLAAYAGKLLSVVTDGHYEDLTVNQDIELGFQADDRVRSAEFLSAGTQDIAYLSLRMALIHLLYTESPPLTLDESFAHQDDNRARGLLKALRILADEGKQIFLYTCHKREAEIAVELGGGFSHIRF